MKSIKKECMLSLKEKILKKQKEMYVSANEFGIKSNQTLTASQELDQLINMYLKNKIEEAKNI